MDNNGYYDMHSHLLYGVDDGSPAIEETMRALHIAYEEGIRHIVFTPHYIAGRADKNQIDWKTKMAVIRQESDREQMEDLTFYEGNEIFYSAGIPDLLKEGRIKTIAGTRYVLVEFMPGIGAQELFRGIREIIQTGFQPILAHVERYNCLYRERSHIIFLRNMGVLLQMNTECLECSVFDKYKRWFRGLAVDGDIQLIATDAHGADYRAPRMRQAVRWLERHCTETIVRKLLIENPQAVLSGKFV